MWPWKVFGFQGLVSLLKINVMLESVCFPRVSVRVEDQCDFENFVFLMGESPNGKPM